MVKRKSDSPKKGGRVTSAKQNKPKKKTVNVLQDIANLQNTTNLLIPRAPFLRVVREVMQSISGEDYRITSMAFEALREAAESHLVCTLEDAYSLAHHAKRCTLMKRDIELIMTLRQSYGQTM